MSKAAAAAKSLQSCPTLRNPIDGSSPGFPVPRILQARTLEWVAISFSRGSSWPRDQTWVSCLVGRSFTIWVTRKAPKYHMLPFYNHTQFPPTPIPNSWHHWSVLYIILSFKNVIQVELQSLSLSVFLLSPMFFLLSSCHRIPSWLLFFCLKNWFGVIL